MTPHRGHGDPGKLGFWRFGASEVSGVVEVVNIDCFSGLRVDRETDADLLNTKPDGTSTNFADYLTVDLA